MPSHSFVHKSYPSLAPPSVSLPCSMPSMLPSTSQSYLNPVVGIAWVTTNRETLLKAPSRQRSTETSGIKIRAFLADAELILTLCSRSRDRWGFFVLVWLGFENAEKVRRAHVSDTVASYDKFRDGLIALFGRFEFEGAYRATLRGLRQSGFESVAAYAARTTDLCMHVEFSPSSHPKRNCRSLSTISSLNLRNRCRASAYNASERSSHWNSSKLCESRKQAKHHGFRVLSPVPPLPALHTTRGVPLRHSLPATNRTL